MIGSLPGSRCGSVRRLQHRFADQRPGELGPLELGWADGSFTTLDANADWTLSVSSGPWVDPFADASPEALGRLAAEVGLWEPAPLADDLRQIVGRTVTGAEPILDEVGELTGLELRFGEVVLVAEIDGGNLVVRTTPS